MDIELIAPTVALHDEWLANAAEWGGVTHHPGAGSHYAHDLDLRSPRDFATWVSRLIDPEYPQTGEQWVPATSWWMVDGERYLGAIQLRHRLNEMLAELGGHIGYHVRPSERRKGIATFALRRAVDRARLLRLDEVLITCDESNVASRRTAESVGGRLTGIRPVDGYGLEHGFTEPTCLYWIRTDGAGADKLDG